MERFHRTGKHELHPLLTSTDDADLNQKLAALESFSNLSRPRGAFQESPVTMPSSVT